MTRISAQEKKNIQEETKTFLKEFSRKLDKIKEGLKESLESSEFRKEKEGAITDFNFRERIFQNAPLKDDNLIFAEVGNWK